MRGKTQERIRYHEHDFLEAILWIMNTKGNILKDHQDTTIFGEDSIHGDRSAHFTGKLYDEDLWAYTFLHGNYDVGTVCWALPTSLLILTVSTINFMHLLLVHQYLIWKTI